MLSKRILVLMFVVAFLFVGCLPTPTPPNGAPIITSDPITTATVGVLYTYNVNATDPDDDALTYSLITKPSGMIINSVTGVIFWTPIVVQVGNNSIIVKVSDGSLSINQSFIIKVSKPSPTPINHAPVIYSTEIITAKVGVLYTYDVNATDPDGDALTYSLTTKPSGMFINSVNGLIWWVPSSVQVGNNLVTVMVSDGILIDIQSFTITVSKPTPTPINQKPVITSIPSLTATVGVTYTYTIEATDPDGDTITYSLVSPWPVGMTFDAPATINWTPTSAQIGNNNVTVKASDMKLSDIQSFTIVVREPSVPTKTYTIIAIAGDGGSISPSGIVTVDEGSDKLFTITPDSVFYGIKDVLVDENSVGAKPSYTFGSVTEDHTISATFESLGPVYNQDIPKHYDTIQAAVGDASAGNTILVSAGVYNEDVTIDKSLTLVSTEGKDNTIINGKGVGYTGAIVFNAGISDVTIGDIGQGFTINAAGQAALFLEGVNDNITIRDNKIVAVINGNCAIETGGLQSNHTIADNEFSGIASQLVYIGGEASHAGKPSTAVNFTNNTFAGAATGPALGQEADNSEISGNIFATVTGKAALELWGAGNTVNGNDFTADLPPGEAYVLDSSITLDPFIGYDLVEILNDNTFLRDVAIVNNEIIVVK